MVRSSLYPIGSLVLTASQMAVKNCFIRGSVVRYVQLPGDNVDKQLLEDATRRGASSPHNLLLNDYERVNNWDEVLEKLM